jgi:glycosyltransferase
MKFSVITPTYNSASSVKETIRSVAIQNYPDVEHLIVDGLSTDKTLEVIESNASSTLFCVSEKDQGIYDAMNKGFSRSSGDVVSFLNSDDVYCDENVLTDVALVMEDDSIDFVFGDISMVSATSKIYRVWQSDEKCRQLISGSQIPHPALFVRRTVLEKLNPPFDSSLKISADLKQQLIFVNKMRCKGEYIPRILVTMALGGASTGSIGGYITGWNESARVYNEVFGRGGILFTARKVASKLKGLKLKKDPLI